MDAKFSVTTQDSSGSGLSARSYGNINRAYFGSLGVPIGSVEPSISGVALPKKGTRSYETFWEWADDVGRAIASLSVDAYNTSKVSVSWDVGEEVAD